jgi:hypothetical protein
MNQSGPGSSRPTLGVTSNKSDNGFSSMHQGRNPTAHCVLELMDRYQVFDLLIHEYL